MLTLWGPQTRYGLWRRRWLALAESQQSLGIDIPDKAIEAIRKQLEGFDEIRTTATTVINSGTKIDNRARIMGEALSKQLETLATQFEAVKGVSSGSLFQPSA